MEFIPPEISDHCPAFIRLQQVYFSSPKPFKFFNHWIKHPNFMKIVEESWKGLVYGDLMNVLFQRMKRLKVELRRFNQAEFGNITAKLLKKEMS